MNFTELEESYKNVRKVTDPVTTYSFLFSLARQCRNSHNTDFLGKHKHIIDICFNHISLKSEGRGYKKRNYSYVVGELLFMYLKDHPELRDDIMKRLQSIIIDGNKMSKQTATKVISRFYLSTDSTQDLTHFFSEAPLMLKPCILKSIDSFLVHYNLLRPGKFKKTYDLNKLNQVINKALFSKHQEQVSLSLLVISKSVSHCLSNITPFIKHIYSIWEPKKEPTTKVLKEFLSVLYTIVDQAYLYVFKLSDYPEVELFIPEIVNLLHNSKDGEVKEKCMSLLQLYAGLENQFFLKKSKKTISKLRDQYQLKNARSWRPLSLAELEAINQNTSDVVEICNHYQIDFENEPTLRALTQVFSKWIDQIKMNNPSKFTEQRIVENIGSAFGNYLNDKYDAHWFLEVDKWGEVLMVKRFGGKIFPLDIVQKRITNNEKIDFESIEKKTAGHYWK